MGDNKDDRKKLEGQRESIRLHIKKYQAFTHPQDKEFALKTIQRAQMEINKLKRGNPGLDKMEEDVWTPGKQTHY
jgi:hypothetical protein